MGNIKGKKILDLGCGSGHFSKMLARKGAVVVAVDQSERWIALCKKENRNLKRVAFLVADGSDLKKWKNASFDKVVMSMVLLNVESKKKVERIFKEISRVLKRNGELLFTDLHPACYWVEKKNVQDQLGFPKKAYFQNGFLFKSKTLLSDYSPIEFNDVHWTIEFYTKAIDESGLHIQRIIEPKPVRNAPRILKNCCPGYILFQCKKK